MALLSGCAMLKPQTVYVPTPAQVQIKYLPAETTVSRDSSDTKVERVHDTLTKQDTIKVTTIRWKETVKEKRVIDTITNTTIVVDTLEKKVPVGMRNWQAYTLIVVFFLVGGGIVYVVTRIFRR